MGRIESVLSNSRLLVVASTATVARSMICCWHDTVCLKTSNCRNFRINHGQLGHVTVAIPDAAFSAIRFVLRMTYSMYVICIRSAFLTTATLLVQITTRYAT